MELYFTIGSIRVKDKVRFDVTAYKVEMAIVGKVNLELIDNLVKLNISVKTTYSTSFNITRIELELPDNEQLIFDPLEREITGKGIHDVIAENALDYTELSQLKKVDTRTISGRIFFTQNNTQIAGSYRFYKIDFKLVK